LGLTGLIRRKWSLGSYSIEYNCFDSNSHEGRRIILGSHQALDNRRRRDGK
jgi:hypothetical protein